MAGLSEQNKKLIRQSQEDVVSRLHPGDLVKIHRQRDFFTHWAVYIGHSLVIHVQVQEEEPSLLTTSHYHGGNRANSNRRFPKGSKFTSYDDGTFSVQYPDGSYSHHFPDGTKTSGHSIDKKSYVYPELDTRVPDRHHNHHNTEKRYIWQRKSSEVLMEYIYDVAEYDKIELGNDWDREKSPMKRKDILDRAKRSLGTSYYHPLYKNCEHFARWCRYDHVDSDQSNKILAGLTMGPVIGGLLLGGPVGAVVAGAVSFGAIFRNYWTEG